MNHKDFSLSDAIRTLDENASIELIQQGCDVYRNSIREAASYGLVNLVIYLHVEEFLEWDEYILASVIKKCGCDAGLQLYKLGCPYGYFSEKELIERNELDRWKEKINE